MLRDPNCLDRFGAMIAGIGAAAAVGATGGAAGVIGGVAVAAGIMQVGCGGLSLLYQRLRGQKSDAEAALARHLERTKRNWRDWSGVSAIRDPGGQESAVFAFETFFSRTDPILPSPERIMAAGRSPEALAAAMLEEAARHAPDLYGDNPANRLARGFFSSVTKAALESLFANPDFATLLQPAFQATVLGSLGEIAAMVKELVERERYDIPLPVAQRIAARFGAEMDLLLQPEKIAPFLEAKAAELSDLRARLTAPSNEDDEDVQALRRAAAALLDEGDFAGADAKLAEAEALDEAREREEEAKLARRRASRARSRSERGDMARARLAYREAAEHYELAAGIVIAEPEAAWGFEMRRAEALYDLGREFGDNGALAEAIDIYSNVILPRLSRKTHPLDWGATMNMRGSARAMLGDRFRDINMIREPTKDFLAALDERTKELTPYGWAVTKNNLTNSLSILAMISGNLEMRSMALRCYIETLDIWTPTKHPSDWAGAHFNIGVIYMLIGKDQNNKTQLKKSVKSINLALSIWKKKEYSTDWALAQNGLATALLTLGEIESDKSLIESAKAAYDEALIVRTIERIPWGWAVSTGGKGVALLRIAEIEASMEKAREAVSLIEDAIKAMKAQKQSHGEAIYAACLTEARALLARLSAAQ